MGSYEAEEGSYRELAERFIIAPSTVQEWMDLYRQTGGLEARACGRKADPGVEERWRERLTALLGEQNDLTLAELVEQLDKRYGQQSSTSAVDRWLGRLEISRKKRPSGRSSRTASGSGG